MAANCKNLVGKHLHTGANQTKVEEKNNAKMVQFLSSFEELFLWRLEASPGPWVPTSVVDPDPPGSAFVWLSWIRIRFWECGSGSRSMEIGQNLQINLVFCLSKRLCTLAGMFFDLTP
jgi:hypothetical protein